MQSTKQINGISICISSSNSRDGLFASVHSALACAKELATHGIGCEVLILDNHSRDGSQRLMLRLAMMDPTGCLHAIAGSLNLGPGATRNRCLLESRYQWVCFLDPGNELIPANLAQFYLAAKQTGAALVCGNVIKRNIGQSDEIDLAPDKSPHNAMSIVDAEQATAVGGFSKDLATGADQEFLHHLISEDRQIVFVPLLLGTCYQQATDPTDEMDSSLPRTINLPRIYHPATGFLDNVSSDLRT